MIVEIVQVPYRIPPLVPGTEWRDESPRSRSADVRQGAARRGKRPPEGVGTGRAGACFVVAHMLRCVSIRQNVR